MPPVLVLLEPTGKLKAMLVAAVQAANLLAVMVISTGQNHHIIAAETGVMLLGLRNLI
jgi:hypothetical protein